MNKKLVLVLVAVAATMSFATRIGVLKNGAVSCTEEVFIRLDTEDDDGRTKLSGPDKNAPGVEAGRSDAKFTYCVLDVNSAPSASFDYAVLRLDSKCPEGTYAFARHHDCEDSKNANKKSGNYYPNVIDKNATLEYCLVPASSTTKKYPFSKNYGVFAKPDPAINGLSQYKLYIDDEDNQSSHETGEEACRIVDDYDFEYTDNGVKEKWIGSHEECDPVYSYSNSNKWIWHSSSWKYSVSSNLYKFTFRAQIMSRVGKIMYGDENTTYHIVKWNGSALAKESATVSAPEIAAPVVANSAATIKNITRDNIGVELSTAGDVEISVMGVNGKKFASFTVKNLQPGFNSIKWNSANVPDGHYIVSVKQNGLVRGVNVTIK